MSFGELIFVGIIALIFIGPKQLPEIARTLGRVLAELKRATGDLGEILVKPRSYMKDQLKEQFRQMDQITNEVRLPPLAKEADGKVTPSGVITLDDLKPVIPIHQSDQTKDPNFSQKGKS